MKTEEKAVSERGLGVSGVRRRGAGLRGCRDVSAPWGAGRADRCAQVPAARPGNAAGGEPLVPEARGSRGQG